MALSSLVLGFAYANWSYENDPAADAGTNVTTDESMPAEPQLESYPWHDQAAAAELLSIQMTLQELTSELEADAAALQTVPHDNTEKPTDSSE